MSSASDKGLLIGDIPEVARRGDLNELWGYIERGVSTIHSDPDVKLSAAAFMDFHTAIWRFITHKAGDNHNGLTVEAGKGLYRRLSEFLTHHLRSILEQLEACERETLLGVYLNRWVQFSEATKRVDVLFRSLNQHWVRRSIEEGKTDIYEIRILHFVKWRLDVWEKVSDRLIDVIQESLELQSREEIGDAANTKLAQSFTALHIAESSSHDIRQDIRKGLEKPFEEEIEAHNDQIRKWTRRLPPVIGSADTKKIEI